jgi:hypothetical protein
MVLGLIVSSSGFNGAMGGDKTTCRQKTGGNSNACTQCCQDKWRNKPDKLNKCLNICQGQHPHGR